MISQRFVVATTDITQTAASNPVSDSIVQDNKRGAQTNPLAQSFIADNARTGAESKAKSDVVTNGFKQFSQMADQIAGEAPKRQIVETKITFQDAAPADEKYSQQVAEAAAKDKAQNFARAVESRLLRFKKLVNQLSSFNLLMHWILQAISWITNLNPRFNGILTRLSKVKRGSC